MSDEIRDGSLLIGLHKLAEQNGEGLVPELYALVSQAASAPVQTAANVVAFPAPAPHRPGSADTACTIAGGPGAVVVPLRRR